MSQPDLALDPRTYDRALACVHCGLCLPACPTFVLTGDEADSPRGRIQLMRGISDGQVAPTPQAREHLDRCLDCRACETACPSGVVYHELIEETRVRLATLPEARQQQRWMKWIFFHLLTHPMRLRLALLPARLLQKLGSDRLIRLAGAALPASLRKMLDMLPRNGPLWPARLPPRTLPRQPKTPAVRIGFLDGCVGSVLGARVNRMAVELLAAAGAEVIVPRQQTCCGAIHLHNGDAQAAQVRARRNIDAFVPNDAPPVDLIVTAIAGCGAMLAEVDHLLRDDPVYAERARVFAAKVKDISQALLALGLPPMPYSFRVTAAYHDACHLAHARKIVAEPRTLLSQVPGLNVTPLAESDMCCGAAGTYNLTQPAMSTALADRKLSNLIATGAEICITGNIGCGMQIQSIAEARGHRLRVLHPVEVLHAAVFGEGKQR